MLFIIKCCFNRCAYSICDELRCDESGFVVEGVYAAGSTVLLGLPHQPKRDQSVDLQPAQSVVHERHQLHFGLPQLPVGHFPAEFRSFAPHRDAVPQIGQTLITRRQ